MYSHPSGTVWSLGETYGSFLQVAVSSVRAVTPKASLSHNFHTVFCSIKRRKDRAKRDLSPIPESNMGAASSIAQPSVRKRLRKHLLMRAFNVRKQQKRNDSQSVEEQFLVFSSTVDGRHVISIAAIKECLLFRNGEEASWVDALFADIGRPNHIVFNDFVQFLETGSYPTAEVITGETQTAGTPTFVPRNQPLSVSTQSNSGTMSKSLSSPLLSSSSSAGRYYSGNDTIRLTFRKIVTCFEETAW
jgi:hypothetical protein